MLRATVRKDLMEKGDIPPTSEGMLPEEFMKSEFAAIQPQEIEDDEFNTVIKIKDCNGDLRSFLVMSIDFDFHGQNLTKEAFGFRFVDIRARLEGLREYNKELPETVTDEQCSEILDYLIDCHDMELGVSWTTLEEAVEEVLLGHHAMHI